MDRDLAYQVMAFDMFRYLSRRGIDSFHVYLVEAGGLRTASRFLGVDPNEVPDRTTRMVNANPAIAPLNLYIPRPFSYTCSMVGMDPDVSADTKYSERRPLKKSDIMAPFLYDHVKNPKAYVLAEGDIHSGKGALSAASSIALELETNKNTSGQIPPAPIFVLGEEDMAGVADFSAYTNYSDFTGVLNYLRFGAQSEGERTQGMPQTYDALESKDLIQYLFHDNRIPIKGTSLERMGHIMSEYTKDVADALVALETNQAILTTVLKRSTHVSSKDILDRLDSDVLEKLKEYHGALKAMGYVFNNQQPRVTVERKEHSNMTVLMIEDNEDTRQSTLDLLGLHGYRAVGAENGSEGLRLYQEERPGAVILDLNLDDPRITGREVLRIIRTKDKDTPIIIASGAVIDARETENLRLEGATETVIKPWSLDDLLKRLQVYLVK